MRYGMPYRNRRMTPNRQSNRPVVFQAKGVASASNFSFIGIVQCGIWRRYQMSSRVLSSTASFNALGRAAWGLRSMKQTGVQ